MEQASSITDHAPTNGTGPNSVKEPCVPVTIMLELSKLKAIDLLASTDETRIVLCGVQVEVTGKNVKLVATDGRKLGVLNLPGTVVRDEEEAALSPDVVTSFIIPSAFIGKATRAFKGKTVPVTIERDEKNNLRISTLDGTTLCGVAVDGKFPNWVAALPLTPPVAQANLNCNADFLSDFHSVSRLLCEDPALYLRGHADPGAPSQHSYSVRFPNPDFFGFFMPIRVERPEIDGELPKWLPKPELVAAVA